MTFGASALLTWMLTAGGGAVLLVTWVRRGAARAARLGAGRPASPDRPPPYIPRWLPVVHMLLAVSGMAMWSAYVVRGGEPLAVASLVVLAVVALLGSSMFVRWLGSRRLRRASRLGAPSESRLPTVIVAVHGVSGLSTVVLVVLTVLRA